MSDAIEKEFKWYHWVAGILLMFYAYFAHAYVVMQLWRWLISDYYKSYTVGYSEAFVVIVFISLVKILLFGYKNEKFDMTLQQFKDGFYRQLVRPWVILFTGWIFKIIIEVIW